MTYQRLLEQYKALAEANVTSPKSDTQLSTPESSLARTETLSSELSLYEPSIAPKQRLNFCAFSRRDSLE